MAEKATEKMIVLRSSDGHTFEVEESIALQSQTIKHMIEDGCADSVIPVPNVDAKILASVIEYCKKHGEATANASTQGSAAVKVSDQSTKAFDAEFIKVDQATLFDLILAANYLNIKSLLDLACQTVSEMMREKSAEEIRKLFGIVNDFTPEEEEAIRKEHSWAFQ